MTAPALADFCTQQVQRTHGIHEVLLNVYRLGSGPPVVMLPGIGRPSSDLAALARLMAQAGYTAVLPEPRGMGRSSGPLAGITLQDLAADVAAVIEAQGARPTLVVGHAFGNRVARTLATDRPDLVDTIALLSCSGKVPHDAAVANANHVGIDLTATAEERAAAARAVWFGPGADPTPWLSGWNLEVRAAFVEAGNATPLEHWWTAGNAQVLIVQGLDDVSAPAANGHLLKEDLGQRGTLVELPGVGHSLPVEAPAAIANALLDYLRKQA